MAEPGPQPKVLLGDKGYDTDAVLADLQAKGIVAVIPPKRNRKAQPVIDGHLYALRDLVERCFSKPKHSRRLATRYDKTADSYLGFFLVASIRLWVRHFVNRNLVREASEKFCDDEAPSKSCWLVRHHPRATPPPGEALAYRTRSLWRPSSAVRFCSS